MPRLHSTYCNVMEPIAAAEVERKIRSLPADIAGNIDKNDVLVRTLNRLSPLYATTEQGWKWHQKKARESLGTEIDRAIDKAIQKSLNFSTNLTAPMSNKNAAEVALGEIEALLGCKDLSWCDVVSVISETLEKTASGKISRCPTLHLRSN